MKIEELDIKGFGTLINRKFSFPRTGVTILTGKNEAGKTTFLEFVRRMLFGFPTGRVASKEYDPITGLVKGGALSVIFRDGTRYTIYRVKASNRKIQQHLLLEDGTSAQVEELYARMGKIRKDFYNRIFALSHLDLWKEGTLVHDTSVKDFLIGGLLSIKKSNPHVIAENCIKEANKLFLQRGSVPVINALNAELKKINRKIREIEEKTDEYHEKSNKLGELQQEKKRLERQELTVQKELSHYRMLSEARDPWVTIAQKKNEINAIIIPDTFSVDQDRRIEELQAMKNKIDQELNRLKDEHDELNTKIDQIKPNEEILSKESDIIQINRLHQQYIADMGRLPTIRSKLSGKRRDLDIALEGLGQFWTEEKLDTITLSSDMKNAMFTAKVTLENSERELLQITNHIQSLKGEISRMQQDIPTPDREKLSAADSINEIEKIISGIQSSEQQENLLARQLQEAEGRYENSLSSLADAEIEISPSFPESFQYDAVSSSVRTFEEEIQNHERQVRVSQMADTQAERDLTRCRDDQRETEATIESLGKIYPADALKRRLKVLYELRDLLKRREKQRESGYSPGFGSNLAISALLFIVGLLSVAAGFFSGQFILIGTGIGILLISGVLYLIDRNARNVRAEEEDRLDQEIEIYSKKLNIKIQKPDEIDRIISQTEQLADRSRQAEALQITLSQTLKRKANAEEDKNQAEATLKGAMRDLDACLHRWYDFLSETLSPVFSERKPAPRDVYPLLSLIQTVSRESSEINRIKQGITGIHHKKQAAVAGCREMLSPLMNIFAIEELPADSMGLIGCINVITGQVQTELNKQERVDTLLEAMKRRNLKLDEEHRSHNVISDRLIQEREKFRETLNWSGLPADCSPDRLESLIQEILAARTQYTGLKETQHELDEVEKQIRSYEEQVYSLRELIAESTRDSSVNFLTERLVSLLSNEKETISRRDTMLEAMRSCIERIDVQKNEQELAQMEEDSLLSDAGVPDYNSFCEYRSLVERKNGITEEIGRQIGIINMICGDPAAYDQVDRELTSKSKEEVMAAIETGSSIVSEIREQMSGIDREIGSIGKEMSILKESDEHNRLLLERNILHTSIYEHAQKWAVQILAAELLRQSLEKFEREKQPAVVSKATEYFRTMTNGAYNRIILPISGDDFEVSMENSVMKGPDILSQGTAEQLYVSLRLAYATEYCLQNEPLPLVLDDILINCDEERHARAIHAIGSVAEHAQVIYCTCHNEAVKKFSGILDDVHIIDLDSPDSLYQRREDANEMTIKGEGYSVL